MANSNQQPPKKDNTTDESMRQVRSKMQGYKEPVAETPPPAEPPNERPLNEKSKPAKEPDRSPENTPNTTDVVDNQPAESSTYNNISGGLMSRFENTAGVENDRYKSRPWRQLPTETALEYALFGQYLNPPLAQGRDLEELAARLSTPELSDWYSRLLNTLPVPKYVIEGFEVKEVKKKVGGKDGKDKIPPNELVHDREAETRALWWLAERNYWPERGRLYDAWGLDVLAEKRKLQIQTFAQEMHSHYVDHSYEMLTLLTESRKGLVNGVTKAGGMFQKLKEQHITPPSGPGKSIVTRDMEWDPAAQLEAIHKISDRLFGPLPNMLDGKVTTVLDHSLTLPGSKESIVNGTDEDGIPEKKRGDSPWLMERFGKVQRDLDRKKLIEAPTRPEGAGENEKPPGA